jgi:hypothetical protein
MEIYDRASDTMEPPALARRCVRQRFRLLAAVMTITGAIGALVLSGRMRSQPTMPLVLALTAGCALLFGAPLLLLSLVPPPPLVAVVEAQVESRRRSGKPIRAFSTAFLILVFVVGIVFAAALATLMPLPPQ